MKRILSTLFTAGLVSAPIAAANGASFVRADGTVFDSDVGAVYGALHTDVLFEPGERSVDLYDESVLEYLAQCLSTGELRGALVAVIGYGGDGMTMAAGDALAQDRVQSVIAYLVQHGVSPWQLATWSYATGWPGDSELSPDRVQFRILQDQAALDASGTF